MPQPRENREARELSLFESLRVDDGPTVPAEAIEAALTSVGLSADDPRLGESLRRLRRGDAARHLDFEEFLQVVQPNIVLIEKALQGRVVIPDFPSFRDEIGEIVARTRADTRGEVADYIPQLARVEPDQYGVALCTIDGQRASYGDASVDFCLQSCCKPINYCLALEDQGEETVHRHIGREPSGRSFNELTLNDAGLPHNPMINAGAVMACALVRPDLTNADRFDHVMETWQRAAGGAKPGFSNPTYLSERQTADRNYALGYFMREKKAFPEGTDLVETLEFYFQCCSIEMTAESMSVVAATLANGGVCPLTGEKVFEPSTVQKCLSLMYSCGLYDFSGEWAFTIGLPGKSGVAGAIFVVVPNVMGLCTWSPRLDAIGNSVRGVEFFRELVGTYNFHNYDNLVEGVSGKKDPRVGQAERQSQGVAEICWAASEGDLMAVRRLVACGVRPDQGDYDGRTALHLAVCGGHRELVEYFIRLGVDLSPRDRWDGTPLDDALREGRQDIAELLDDHGAERGSKAAPGPLD